MKRYYVKNRITSFGVQDRRLGVSITGSKRHTEEEAQVIADFHNARWVAAELEAAGWPAVAADVRDGLPLETVLERLRDIGESDSEAAEIVSLADC